MTRLLAPRFDIVGTAGDGLEALRLANELRPDAVVLDLAMPGLDGLAVAPGIRQAGLAAAIVILTVTEDPALVEATLAAGAPRICDQAVRRSRPGAGGPGGPRRPPLRFDLAPAARLRPGPVNLDSCAVVTRHPEFGS